MVSEDRDFRVYSRGTYPRRKRLFFSAEFKTRQKARNFCRNRVHTHRGLTIVHPDGKEERYDPAED